MSRDLLAYGITTFYVAAGASLIGSVAQGNYVVMSHILPGTSLLMGAYGTSTANLSSYVPVPSTYGIDITGPAGFCVFGTTASVIQYLTQGFNATLGA